MSASKMLQERHIKDTLTVISRLASAACNICPLMRSGGESQRLDDCTVWRFWSYLVEGLWWHVLPGPQGPSIYFSKTTQAAKALQSISHWATLARATK